MSNYHPRGPFQRVPILAFVLLLHIVSTGLAQTDKGEPLIEVPTIAQGRALLARDLLHRQCYQAMEGSEWSNVSSSAKKALTKEKEVFGDDFPGSSMTLLFLDMAESELGMTRSSASRMLEVFDRDIKKLKSRFPNSEISSEPPIEFVRALELDRKIVELITLEVEAKRTGDFTTHDVHAISLANELFQLEQDYDDQRSKLAELEKELEDLLRQEASDSRRQEIKLYLEDTEAMEPKNVVDENGYVFLSASEAALRQGDQRLALKYARRAFEAATSLNEQWWTDEELSGGLAVGQHLFQQLLGSQEEARIKGNWNQAIALMEEAGLLTTHLKDSDAEHLRERAIKEAKSILGLDSKKQAEYAELIQIENELGPNTLDGDLNRVMEIAKRRAEFIGENNDLIADDENMLAVLHSQRGEHLETVRWARNALHRYLKQRGADSSQVKTTANNYLTTLVRFVGNGEIDFNSALMSQLEETTKLLIKKHGETPMSAQFTLETSRLKKRAGFTNEQKQQLNNLYKIQAQRDFHFSQGRFDLAIPSAEKCVQVTAETWGDDSWVYADNQRALANCLTNIGQSGRAIEILSEIEERFDRFPYNQSSAYGWFLHGFAFALRNQGKPDSVLAAIDRLEKARDVERRVKGKLGAYAAHTELLGETYRDYQGDTPGALLLFQEAAQTYQQMGDEGKWGYCQALVNAGLCRTNLGRYEQAAKELLESLEVRTESGFENPHMEAWNHWAIGNNAFYAHQFSESVDHFGMAIDLKEQHTPDASDIDDIYGQMIRSACWATDLEVEPLVDRFINSASLRKGNQTIEFANACQTASFHIASGPDPGVFLASNNQRQSIQTLLNLAIGIYQREGKESSQRAIYAMKGLADSWLDRPEERLRSYREVIGLSEKHEPVLWDSIGLAHVAISNVYRDYFQSPEQCLDHRRLAKDALARAFGDGSTQVADVLKGQAETLMSLGDFDKAEELLGQSLDNVLARGGNPVGQYMLLSKLYSNRGDEELAEQYLYTARNELGQRKFSDAFDRDLRLAVGAIAIKQHDYQRAKEIAEVVIAEANGDSRTESRARFNARAVQGKALLGLKQYRRANELLAGVLGDSNDDAFLDFKIVGPETRTAYARSCMFVGEQPRTQRLLLEQFRETVNRHSQSASRLTPRQQLGLRRAIQTSMSAYLSFSRATGESAHQLYEQLFDAKGIVSSRPSMSDAMANDPERRIMVERLAATSQELSALLFGQPNEDASETVKRIQELTSTRESIQLKISEHDRKKTNLIEIEPEQLRLASLQNRLGDACLIDFIIYEHSSLFSPDKTTSSAEPTQETNCLAFVVKRDSVEAVDLGTIDKLTLAIARWREALTAATTDFDNASQAILEELWSPILAHLPSAGHLLIAADGPLQQLAFAAVRDGTGGYLIDRYAITMVPSPRYILRGDKADILPIDLASTGQVLLVGDVDYRSRDQEIDIDELPTTEMLANAQDSIGSSAPRAFRGETWSHLSGTAAEVDAIAAMIQSSSDRTVVRKLSGHEANEAAVSLLSPQSRILHFATHGFFAQATESSPWQLQTLSRDAVMGFDPQLLTGVVLSGANGEPSDGTDDGILTAAEIETLGLEQTELAVLSACETALGETTTGEGVLGLQRALHMAGCKNVVASLWKVDDHATKVLMTLFYRNLLVEKMDTADALRQAQIWMLNHPKEVFDPNVLETVQDRGIQRLSANSFKAGINSESKRLAPKYWAAFSLSGNPN